MFAFVFLSSWALVGFLVVHLMDSYNSIMEFSNPIQFGIIQYVKMI